MTQIEEAKLLMTKLIAKNKELSDEIIKLKNAAKSLEADSEAFAKLKEEHDQLSKANQKLYEENDTYKKILETSKETDAENQTLKKTLAHYQSMESEIDNLCIEIKKSLSESDVVLS